MWRSDKASSGHYIPLLVRPRMNYFVIFLFSPTSKDTCCCHADGLSIIWHHSIDHGSMNAVQTLWQRCIRNHSNMMLKLFCLRYSTPNAPVYHSKCVFQILWKNQVLIFVSKHHKINIIYIYISFILLTGIHFSDQTCCNGSNTNMIFIRNHFGNILCNSQRGDTGWVYELVSPSKMADGRSDE